MRCSAVPHSLFIAVATISLLSGVCGLWSCRGEERPRLSEVPIPPGALLREEESTFQKRLFGILLPANRPAPDIRVYETPMAFARVVAFYEPYFAKESTRMGRFAVAGRMRQLADAVRRGSSQQQQVGQLLFARNGTPSDSLPVDELADSLAALADRFARVEGLIAIGRIPLESAVPSAALVTIERPHLSSVTLKIDSLTVFTIAVEKSDGRGARAR
jgi:hypothetical protein